METIKKKLILFMPSMEGGGVEKNLILISNFLKNYIKDIDLITFDNKFKKQFSKKINFICPTNRIGRTSKYKKYYYCLILLIKSILTNRNVLIFSFQANIYCIVVAKIFGKKIIVRSNSSPSGWSQNKFKKLIFKFFLKRSDLVIVNSRNFKNQINKIFKIKSICIFNPLNKKQIIKKSKTKVKDNFFDKNDLKIINVARFTDQKDHITLLRAFKLISKKIKSKLLIIGYGKNLKIMKNYILKNNLKSKVKIKEYCSNPFPYIRKSDLFILSSRFEGLPNVILEAMTLKKFVISSNCPTGPSEILKNGKYGFLFEIGNYNDLAKKILIYKKNKVKFERIKDIAYESLSRFDYTYNCKKYLMAVRKFL